MQHFISTGNIFKVKTLSLMVALTLPAFSQAEESSSEAALSTVTVSGQVLGEKTEGTGSYTSGKTKTATPLSMSLRDTPQSVSVMTQQRIEDQGLSDISDVLRNITGVSVNQYETDRAQFTARGFEIGTLMIDGVPTTWSWSAGEVTTSLAIYDRVEVVRGATGLTTGAGDPSAAVNLVRKRATSKEFTGTVDLGVGSWNEQRAMLDLSTALNEAKTLRARVVAESVDGDSWVKNRSNKSQTIFATMEADLGQNTLLSAGYSRQEDKSNGSMWGGLPVWYSDGTRTNWDRSKTTAADWTRWDSVYENYYATLEHRFDNDWKIKATYSYGDRNGDSDLLWMYGTPDRLTGLGMNLWPGSHKIRTQQEDLGLQSSGPFELFGRKHELALGYVSSKQDFDADSRSAPGGLATDFNAWDGSYAEPAWGPLTDYESSTTKQQAVYAAARFNVSDPLKLILGARVTNYERSGVVVSSNPYTMHFSHELTPYAGLVYDLSDTYSVYASYTNIFQPQQKRDINGKYLDPILGNSLEAGVKGEFLGGRLNASAAVFKIKQDNLGQSTGEQVAGATLPEIAYRTSEGATSEGVEFEVSGELAPDWHLSAGLTKFSVTDADGAEVNTTYPRQLLRVFTSYRLPGAWNKLTLGGGVNWQSDIYINAVNPLGVTERVEQKPYAQVNLMARYEFSKQLSAQLNINNLFDQTYFSMYEGSAETTYGAPRSVSLSMKYRF